MGSRPAQQGLNRLQIPSHDHSLALAPTSPSARSQSTDISTLSMSPTLSPRTLYADTIRDRPHTTQGLPAGGSRFRHKDIGEIMGATTENEFDALPLAIRRKYFSSLERLRLAQKASIDYRVPPSRRASLADRRGLKTPFIEPQQRQRASAISSAQRLKKRRQTIQNTDVTWYMSLPESIRKKQFTREEQELLAGRLGDGIILDAADEAVYRAARQAHNIMAPQVPSTISSRHSIDSFPVEEKRLSYGSTDVVNSIYDSFRWMDDEEDLDLRLHLDDYHANLDGAVLPTASSSRRPSFRRHLSISKIPFGRNSFSVSHIPSPTTAQRITKSSIQKPLPPPPAAKPSSVNHSRQPSRATSVTSTRHGVKGSLGSIEHHVSYYQSPEARMKLRVYLASPQKFDEAIEFGFPSLDGVGDANKENSPPRYKQERASISVDKCPTFLHDETTSLFDDDISMVEPDSPLTPYDGESAAQFHHHTSSTNLTKGSKTSMDYTNYGLNRPLGHRPSESFAGFTGSREMTLRMTLTRPDLRSDEEMLYGWQNEKPSRRDSVAPLGTFLLSDDAPELRGPLGGEDGWGPLEKEDGVMKRFWNRVKRTA